MKKSIWIFLLAVLLPAAVLGWLALRSAEEQKIIFERRTAELYQRETEALAGAVRDAIEAERRAFGETVHRLLAGNDPDALARDFTNTLADAWTRKAVGFALDRDGKLISPTLARAGANPKWRDFVMSNGAFLSGAEPAVVYFANTGRLDLNSGNLLQGTTSVGNLNAAVQMDGVMRVQGPSGWSKSITNQNAQLNNEPMQLAAVEAASTAARSLPEPQASAPLADADKARAGAAPASGLAPPSTATAAAIESSQPRMRMVGRDLSGGSATDVQDRKQAELKDLMADIPVVDAVKELQQNAIPERRDVRAVAKMKPVQPGGKDVAARSEPAAAPVNVPQELQLSLVPKPVAPAMEPVAAATPKAPVSPPETDTPTAERRPVPSPLDVAPGKPEGEKMVALQKKQDAAPAPAPRPTMEESSLMPTGEVIRLKESPGRAPEPLVRSTGVAALRVGNADAAGAGKESKVEEAGNQAPLRKASAPEKQGTGKLGDESQQWDASAKVALAPAPALVTARDAEEGRNEVKRYGQQSLASTVQPDTRRSMQQDSSAQWFQRASSDSKNRDNQKQPAQLDEPNDRAQVAAGASIEQAANYSINRKVAPQQLLGAPGNALSVVIPAAAEFRTLTEDASEGLVSRFVQDKLDLIFWMRPPESPEIVLGCLVEASDFADLWKGVLEKHGGVQRASSRDYATESPEFVLALLNDRGQPAATNLAKAEARDWKRPFVATEIGEALPHWEAALYLASPTALADSARGLWRTLAFTIAGAVALIALGGWLVVADARRQLALAQQKTDFVSNVSHELKTPLTSIRMFAELMHGRPQPVEKQSQYLRIITVEAERLTRLINNVLDFARIGRKQKRYEKKALDLHEVVARIWESQDLHLRQAGFTTRWEAAPGPYPITGDEDALSQVLVNLLSNAEKYSTERREVELHSWIDAGHVNVSVLDRGMGVPDGEERKIFEAFYRAHDSLASGIQGSGLGLTLARHVVQDHGGEITFEHRDGGGSRFTLRLPLTGKLRDES